MEKLDNLVAQVVQDDPWADVRRFAEQRRIEQEPKPPEIPPPALAEGGVTADVRETLREGSFAERYDLAQKAIDAAKDRVQGVAKKISDLTQGAAPAEEGPNVREQVQGLASERQYNIVNMDNPLATNGGRYWRDMVARSGRAAVASPPAAPTEATNSEATR